MKMRKNKLKEDVAVVKNVITDMASLPQDVLDCYAPCGNLYTIDIPMEMIYDVKMPEKRLAEALAEMAKQDLIYKSGKSISHKGGKVTVSQEFFSPLLYKCKKSCENCNGKPPIGAEEFTCPECKKMEVEEVYANETFVGRVCTNRQCFMFMDLSIQMLPAQQLKKW